MNEREKIMALVGLVITFVGFLLAVASVGIASSNGVRLVLVVVGIMISMGGILGVINPAYQKNAVWRR
jgi:predicted phage tail protein